MSIDSVLVPVDFSKFSDAALNHAVSLARIEQANLIIVHVQEPFGLYDANCKVEDIPAMPELSKLKTSLQRAVPANDGVEHESWLLTGKPAKCILRFANEHAVDLIVMGTHGRTGLNRVLTGSVAEAVIRGSACPVLTVKQPPAEKAGDKISLPTATQATEGAG